MTAIITNSFRRTARETFLTDFGVNEYFVGLGRTNPWSPGDYFFAAPIPGNTLGESEDVLDSLISLVRVGSTTPLIPKNLWGSGRVYKIYDNQDPTIFDFEGGEYPAYITQNDNVYVCLDNNNGGPSTIPPSSSYATFDPTNHVVKTGDGYVWAFVQNNATTSNFYTDQFIPVNSEIGSGSYTVCKNATGGMIFGFNVENGGTALTGNEKVILSGIDEAGVAIAPIDLVASANFTVNFSGGAISTIVYNDITANALMGYKRASIAVFTNLDVRISGISIRPRVAPLNGFGRKPELDLPSFYAGVFASFKGDVEGEALVDVGVRQISLIKSPERTAGYVDNDVSGTDYAQLDAWDALDSLTLDNISFDFPPGSIISQADTLGRAIVDKVDLVNNKVYFHRDSSSDSNYIPFNGSSDVTISTFDDATTYTYSTLALNEAEYVQGTGEVIFIDNRKAIERNTDQTEDIKLVIQF